MNAPFAAVRVYVLLVTGTMILSLPQQSKSSRGFKKGQYSSYKELMIETLKTQYNINYEELAL